MTLDMAAERYAGQPIVTKRLSAEARAGWDEVAEREEANLTALIEALGRAFHSGVFPRATPHWRSVLSEARTIARERGSRLQR